MGFLYYIGHSKQRQTNSGYLYHGALGYPSRIALAIFSLICFLRNTSALPSLNSTRNSPFWYAAIRAQIVLSGAELEAGVDDEAFVEFLAGADFIAKVAPI